MNRSDAGNASRLIQFGLQPKLRPKEGSDYRRLFDRYRTDTDFAELVRAIAEGLGLYVQVPSQLGLILTGDVDGPFRVTVDNAGLPVRSGTSRLQDRRCFGLVLTAIAAYAYPNGEALTETSNPTVRCEDIERFLARHLDAVVAAAEADDSAVDDLDAQLGEAARMWVDLPDVLPTDRGGYRKDCRRSYVLGALEFLVEQGRARKEPALADPRGEVYALNDRFRIGLSELAETAIFEVLATGQHLPEGA